MLVKSCCVRPKVYALSPSSFIIFASSCHRGPEAHPPRLVPRSRPDRNRDREYSLWSATLLRSHRQTPTLPLLRHADRRGGLLRSGLGGENVHRLPGSLCPNWFRNETPSFPAGSAN